MKRFFAALLVISLMCNFGFVSFAAEEISLPEICEHCGVPVTWTPWTSSDVRSTAKPASGHYYVAMEEDSYDSVCKTIEAGNTVCLYLNGKTLAGTTRGLVINDGGTLNIMGEGKITGRGTTAGVDGACCYIEKGGTLNQYGGTLSYVEYLQRHATNGGVVYVKGTYNLYNGTVENGITKKYHGGNIYVGATGEFNMHGGEVRNGTAEYAGGNIYVHATGIFSFMGGTISGGTAKVAGNSVYNRGTIYFSGASNCNSIFLNTDDANGGPVMGDMLIMDGDFSGDITVESNKLTSGSDIGNVQGGEMVGIIRAGDAMLTGHIQDGNIILATSGYCQHCGTEVEWQPLPVAGDALKSGHYYADKDLTEFEQKNIYVGGDVCIDLNGKSIKSATRTFSVYPDGILNIMGEGTLIGSGGMEKTPNGGVINIIDGGVLNLYGGTLSYEASADTSVKAPSNGGIVNIGGTLNMYGGRISAGIATNAGGSVFVETTGVLNASGGTIEMGKMGASSSNSCIYNRGTVILSGDPSIAQILQKPNVADGGPALGDMLVFRGTFKGQVDVRFSGLTTGIDAGNVENATYEDAAIKINGSTAWSFARIGNDVFTSKGSAVMVFDSDGTVIACNTLAEAVSAVDNTDDRITLLADNAETVALTSDICLDLNGHSFSGNFSGEHKAYCMDSCTADYTVADGVYGRITSVNAMICPADGYIILEENGAYTFHKLSFDITTISVRQRDNGAYFTAEFAGDELVSQNVMSFGIALNAVEIPDADNMQTTSLYSSYSADQWKTGSVVTATGTLLKDIMKLTNDDATNSIHAGMRVFGRAYIETADGYLFATEKSIDLKSILEQTDINWTSLTGKQRNSAVAMYNDFSTVMDAWEIPNLKQEKADKDRYALVEKAAEQSDIEALESLYAGKNAYHGELHDHAATGGTSDGKQPLSVWKTYMNELNMDFAALVDHRQVLHMQREDWDNTIFIGGSEAATTITNREGVKLHYNMTFASPEGLEAVLYQFPEFGYRIWSEADRAGCGGQLHFNYPSFTAERFTELCKAIYANGGFLSIVHPKSKGYVESENPLDAWFADYTGVEIYYTPNSDRNNVQTQANYELWTGMLAAGKKVFATAGNDAHNMPSVSALSTIYSTEKDSRNYVELLRAGNFTSGVVGIRMSVGQTAMGGTTGFSGNRLVLSVADFHESVYDPDHTYRVDLISNEGIVFSQDISCTETSYFAIDTENVMFYRVEVWDTTLNSRLSIGNPIWNADYAV